MTPETLTALERSIDKWERIVDCEEIDKGSDNCGLCRMFCGHAELHEDCRSCPVFNETGNPYCESTPHKEWCIYFEDYNNGYFFVFDKKSYNLALAELEFLKSLLPEEAITNFQQDR